MRYWSGFATGICALALWLFGVFALYFIPNQLEIYKEFKGATLPSPTLLVMSPAWHWAVPTVALIAALAFNLAPIASEGRRVIGLGVTAALLLVALIFTYWALYLPIFELAGSIRSA